jgi:chemotaxis protein methyltransferase CheR
LLIWSAGCSNGQEPYSLAMLLDEAGRADWRIVASDISTRALGRTRRARYSERELRGLTPARRARYLAPAGDGSYEIAAPLRQRVEVVRHNLAADPPPFPPGSCPVVFCRNVLIYFGHRDVSLFLDRLGQWLLPGQWLFVGYSESLWQLTSAFKLERLGEAFAYRRVAAAAAVPEPVPAGPAPTQPARRRPPRPAAPPPGTATAGRAGSAARTGSGAGTASGAGSAGRSRSQAGTAGAGTGLAATDAAAASDDVRTLLAAGEAASAGGDHPAAVASFRKAAYLDPDQPAAHLQLGLALEATGDQRAAQRAFRAARAALGRSGTATVEAALEGFSPAEMTRFLDAKLAGDR